MPVIDLCMFISIAWYMQSFFTPDSIGMGPVPLENKVITLEKLPLLNQAVYANCDGIDGLVDGIIDDPRKCTFDPERDLPRCAGDMDGPNCFTTVQIKALKKIYGGVISKGQMICPKMCMGGEDASF